MVITNIRCGITLQPKDYESVRLDVEVIPQGDADDAIDWAMAYVHEKLKEQIEYLWTNPSQTTNSVSREAPTIWEPVTAPTMQYLVDRLEPDDNGLPNACGKGQNLEVFLKGAAEFFRKLNTPEDKSPEKARAIELFQEYRKKLDAKS